MSRSSKRPNVASLVAFLLMVIGLLSCEQPSPEASSPSPEAPSISPAPEVSTLDADDPEPEHTSASEQLPAPSAERAAQPATIESSPDTSAEQATSRYEMPDNPGRSLSDPVGHVVVLAGTTWADGRLAEMWIIDPADNLTDAGGVHYWNDHATRVPVDSQQEQFVISLGGQQFEVTHALVVASGTPIATSLSTGPIVGMPDFSQHAGAQWNALCAPTAAADVIYYLSRRDPELIKNAPWGPGEHADAAATQLIAGIDAPPATVDSLAARMGTNNSEGTRGDAIVEAVESYTAERGSPSFRWHTRVIDMTSPPTEVAQREMARHVRQGAGVILMLFPVSGAGNGSSSDQSSGQEGGGEGQSSNGSVSSGGENAATGNGGGNTSGEAELSGASPEMHGEAQTNGGPEGMPGEGYNEGGMVSEGQFTDHAGPDVMQIESNEDEDTSSNPVQTKGASTSLIAIDLPPAPIEIALPRLVVPRVESRALSSELTLLTGRWRQDQTDNRADFAEGGYDYRELRINPDGRVYVMMKFAGGITLVRQFQCEVKGNQLVIAPASLADENIAKPRNARTILPSDAKPATAELPMSLAYELTNTTLRIGDKTYRVVEQQ